MKNDVFKTIVFLLPFLFPLSSCSDFRKAVGKEKVIPDEFSGAVTPSIIIPPGYNIDAKVLKGNNINTKTDVKSIKDLNISNKGELTGFQKLFFSENIPKNIRKLVDEESLGISLSERTGIDILFGNIPETGVVIDVKEEAIRIKNNKSLGKAVNSDPTPAIDKSSGKPLLIK